MLDIENAKLKKDVLLLQKEVLTLQKQRLLDLSQSQQIETETEYCICIYWSKMFLFNQIGSPLVLLFLLVLPCMDESKK